MNRRSKGRWAIWVVGILAAHILASYAACLVLQALGGYTLVEIKYAPVMYPLLLCSYCLDILYTYYSPSNPARAVIACWVYLIPFGLVVLGAWLLARWWVRGT